MVLADAEVIIASRLRATMSFYKNPLSFHITNLSFLPTRRMPPSFPNDHRLYLWIHSRLWLPLTW